MKSKIAKFDHKSVETKWQKIWEEEKLYIPDIDSAPKPFYNLWMYPYPSAEGLHAGHAFASTGSDIYGRYQRMRGNDVFQPIGYDSFGMHSENYALKIGEQPAKMISRTTKNYEKQLKNLGHGYDWTRTVTASDVDYYRWTQWIAVQIFKAGLVANRQSLVNWCPTCKTVIADEQVEAGVCERCKTPVEKKNFKQWFFRITEYADKLLEGHKNIDWPNKIIATQKNWIGKSKGLAIKFKLDGSKEELRVFTTRPDTLWGATFLVVSSDSSIVGKITTKNQRQTISKYIDSTQKKIKEGEFEKEKSGVFSGSYAINPANNKKIPIWIADYVLSSYGSGAIMGVPAHDSRDWEFAKKYDLEIYQVVSGGDIKKGAYVGKGKIINSGSWDGKIYPDDLEYIQKDLIDKGWAEKKTLYHLRDWLISRQRYWGAPIPYIFCPNCAKKGESYFTLHKDRLLKKDQDDWDHAGWYPEENLPVELPELPDYQPTGSGKGPLANHPEFYETICPHCGGKAIRETDVCDTFVDSSWYFLRYPSVGTSDANKVAFDKKITQKWLPVNLYFGGAEHSVLHLLYARFVTMVLNDLGVVDFSEPFPKFYAHGLMIKNGAKMSKSRGNVVNPDDYIEKYGADSLRFYLMFIGPMDASPDFRDTGMEGMSRFVNRLWKLFKDFEKLSVEPDKQSQLRSLMHSTIKQVTQEISSFRYNTAIAKIMEYINGIQLVVSEKSTNGEGKKLLFEVIANLDLMIAPFAPHLAEEVWVERLNKPFSVHKTAWPSYDEKFISSDQATMIVQVNGKLRGQLLIDSQDAQNQDKVSEIAKREAKIAKWLEGKNIKKTVFIAGKLINFVIN